MKGPVLILEDEHGWCKLLEERLEEANILPITYTNPSKAIEDIKNGLMYKAALVDLSFEGRYAGDDFLRESKRIHPTVPVIIISGHRDPFPKADGSYWKGEGDVDRLVEIVKGHLQDKKPIQVQ